MGNKTKPIRCNNCMIYYEEEELVFIKYVFDDYMRACPKCKTDLYLMDMIPEESEA